MVRLVLKPGPFGHETWSVLSYNMVRFVLKRGPFCPEHGPFCPWSVLSVVRFVRVPTEYATKVVIITNFGHSRIQYGHPRVHLSILGFENW